MFTRSPMFIRIQNYGERFAGGALYDFRLTIVHRCALLGKMSDWFLRRADYAQSVTGH
jgi:hypothetical protein